MSRIMKMSKIWRKTPEDIVRHILTFIHPKVRKCLHIARRHKFFLWDVIEKCTIIQVVCLLISVWCGYTVIFPPH